jgi:hypothetical protein
VDTIHWAYIDAGGVLGSDAGLGNDVCHRALLPLISITQRRSQTLAVQRLRDPSSSNRTQWAQYSMGNVTELTDANARKTRLPTTPTTA